MSKSFLALIVLFCLFCLGCAQNNILHAWAEKPDGTIERFDVKPEDFHYLPENPYIFYVVSPSGIYVYYAHPLAYANLYTLDETGRHEVPKDENGRYKVPK